jgi:3D (Asp-Asp-Asp) domain-containing protein
VTALVITLALAASSSVEATSYCLRGVMADGSYTRAGSAAMNTVPLGTRVTVDPPVFGRRRWTIRDRIGWGSQLDFWAPSCSISWAFGRRTIQVSQGWPERLYARHTRTRIPCR